MVSDFSGVSEDVLLTEQQHGLRHGGDGVTVTDVLGHVCEQDGDDVLADGVQPPWPVIQVHQGFSLIACR